MGSSPVQANLYSIDIIIGYPRQYQAVALTPAILNRAGTSALRVINRETGEEAPFFIHSSVIEEELQEVYIGLNFIRSAAYEEYYYLDFEVLSEANRDPIISHLQLTSLQEEFLKNIDVFGSYDNQNWEFIANSLVYSVSDVYQNEIDLLGSHRYSFYRLRVPVPQDWIDFDVNGWNRQVSAEFIPFVGVSDAYFYVESIDSSTTVTLTGLLDTIASLENLRVIGIHIETDSLFKRSVRRNDGFSTTLYRLFFQETELENTFIPFPNIPQAEKISFTITDYDDRPINIQRITVEYAIDYVIFRAEAGQEYSLLFGGDLTRPRYDIENFRDLIIQEGFSVAQLQNAMVLIEHGDVEDRDFTLLFNIAIGAAGVLLAVVALVGLKRKSDPAANEK